MNDQTLIKIDFNKPTTAKQGKTTLLTQQGDLYIWKWNKGTIVTDVYGRNPITHKKIVRNVYTQRRSSGTPRVEIILKNIDKEVFVKSPFEPYVKKVVLMGRNKCGTMRVYDPIKRKSINYISSNIMINKQEVIEYATGVTQAVSEIVRG